MADTTGISDQISYYDNRWDEFTYANLFCLERCSFFLKALLDTGISAPRICDLGSGSGWLTGIMSSFGPSLGVELSPAAVLLARRKYPLAEFVAADATQWKPEPGSFDLVVSQEVIEHIVDKAAYLSIARTALRVGGYLLMTTPNLRVLDAVPTEERKSIWEIQPVELPLYRAQLVKLLTDAGFEIVATSSVVDGLGRSGIHRLVNSSKLRVVLGWLGLAQLWRRMLLDNDFGMYMTTVARAK